jgi:hypothetical protein
MMMRLAFGVWLTLMFTVCGCASNELRQPGNSYYPNSPGSSHGGSDAAAGDLSAMNE